MSYTFESIGTEEGIEYVNVIDALGETIAFMLPRAQAETEFVTGSQVSVLTKFTITDAEIEAVLDVLTVALNANAELVKADETGFTVTIALPAERYSDVQVWDALADSGHIGFVDEVLAHG